MRVEADLVSVVRRAAPDARQIVKQDDGIYACWANQETTDFLGYVVFGTADGYGGPMKVAVAVDSDGNVSEAVIGSHKETSSWMARVSQSNLLFSLRGKHYSEGFEIGSDVDGVTGATFTSRAITAAVHAGSREAAIQLDLPVKPIPKPRIVFGLPEVLLLALFSVGYLGSRGRLVSRRKIRWLSMVTGLVFLGFVYNSPVTLAYITKFLLGYWPQWQTNLYWYFLIGGILFVFTVDNKNPYCQWFCPFGAAQECMGLIGGAKSISAGQYTELLKWLQRVFALSAILIGVFFRSPGLASYELFGTLFGFVGSHVEFFALGLVLLAALFVHRPWCRYLCPITPVVDCVRVFRTVVKEQWNKVRTRSKTA